MNGFLNNILKVLEDPGVQQVIAGIVATTVALCFSKVRSVVASTLYKGRKAAAWFIQPEDSYNAPGKIHNITQSALNSMIFIQHELTALQVVSEASRAAVWQFHNGERFLLANPMFKVKSAHESCRNGIMYNSRVMDSVLVSNVLDLVAPVMGDNRKVEGCSTVKQAKDAPQHKHKLFRFDIDSMQTSNFKSMMTTLGVETMFVTILSDAADNPIGMLVVQYMAGDNVSVMDTKEVVDSMYDTRDKIQLTLTNAK